MKRTLTISLLLLVLGACSEDPTSKYANAEECAFKESKECEDKSCASLADSYCKKSFGVNEKKRVLDRTCREYEANAQSCFSQSMQCTGIVEGGFEFPNQGNLYSFCRDSRKTCTENAISKWNKFIKSKCN